MYTVINLLIAAHSIVLCTTIQEFAEYSMSLMRTRTLSRSSKASRRLIDTMSGNEARYTVKGRPLPAVPISDKHHGNMLINQNVELHSEEMKKSLENLKSTMTMEKAFEIAGRENEPVALFAVLRAEREGKTSKDIDPALVDVAIAEVINAIGNATEKIDQIVLERCRPQLSHLKTLIETTQFERERAAQLYSDAESNRLASVSEHGDLIAGRDATETEKMNANNQCEHTTRLLQETVDFQTRQTQVKEVIFTATAASNNKATFLQSVRGRYKICFDKTSVRGRIVFMDKTVNDHLKSLTEAQRTKIANSLAIDMAQVREKLGISHPFKIKSRRRRGRSEDDEESEALTPDEADESVESGESLEVMGDDGGVTRCIKDPEGDTMPLLEDTAGKLYGEQLDELHLAKSELSEEEDRCEVEQRDFTETINNFISRIDKAISSIQFYLGEKESARSEIRQIEAVFYQLNQEFTHINNGCQEEVEEIVTNEYCAMCKIRENILRIYKKKSALRDIQDCVLQPWEEGTCSIQCLQVSNLRKSNMMLGERVDTRAVDIPNNQYGARCAQQELRMPCNNIPCPQDCELGDWGDFGPCSATCDEGTHSRSRPVVTPAKFQGVQCGETVETETCFQKSCGNDCVLSEWQGPSKCQGGCGKGYKFYSRSIAKESAGVGYTECPAALSKKRMRAFTSRSCAKENPCPREAINYQCDGSQSIFFAVDVSGSVTSAGLTNTKKLLKVLFEMVKNDEISTGLAVFSTKLTPIADMKMNQDLSKFMDQIVYAKGGSSSNAHLAIDECIRQIEFENDGSRTATCVLISDGSYSRRVALKDATDRAHEKGIRVFIVKMDSAKERVSRKQASRDFATKPIKYNYFALNRRFYGAAPVFHRALAYNKSLPKSPRVTRKIARLEAIIKRQDLVRPYKHMSRLARKVCSSIVDKSDTSSKTRDLGRDFSEYVAF